MHRRMRKEREGGREGGEEGLGRGWEGRPRRERQGICHHETSRKPKEARQTNTDSNGGDNQAVRGLVCACACACCGFV